MNNTPSIPNSPASAQINEAIKNVAAMNTKIGGKRSKKTRNRKTKRKQTRKNRKARKGTRRH